MTTFQTEFPKANLVDPPPPPKIKKKRKTYPRNWNVYNSGQTKEKAIFLRLLKGLCETIDPEEETNEAGRPPLPISDLVYLSCFKVYTCASTRRFMSDAQFACSQGLVSCVPHHNTVINALNSERLTDILLDFIQITSLPVQPIERTFAADSSGFTNSTYTRWLDIKSAKERQQHTWTKLHLMCGVTSHIVTAVVIKDKNASDPKQLPELVKTTAENFRMDEVYADKAYASIPNYNLFHKLGITPYIAFKSNHTGSGKGRDGKMTPGGELWGEMFHMFRHHSEEFYAHYHQRNNVETVFSMMKKKFGTGVRSKTETAALNEVLCKIVCHNICCLIMAMLEFKDVNIDHLFPSKPVRANLRLIEGGRSDQVAERRLH